MVARRLKGIACLGISLCLAGCFGGDIECDSSVTKQRIVGDFYAHLKKTLPEGAMNYISTIELIEVVTLAADKEAVTRSCEARVVVHTSVSDAVAFQDIKYENQTVSGGKETSRGQYVYLDTFHYISSNAFDLIKDPYQREIAKKAGFDSYSKYKVYADAKARLSRSESEIEGLSKSISDINEALKELYPVVAPIEDAIRSGKSVLLPNSYLSMTPVLVNVGQVETNGLDRNLVFSAAIKNISTVTLDSLYLSAEIYINDQRDPLQANQFTTVKSVKGFKPGETRKVTISVSGNIGIIENFLSTTAWEEAESVQIRLTPTHYNDASGREGRIGEYRDSFSLRNSNKGEPIVWKKYKELKDMLGLKTARLATVKSQVESDKSILGSNAAGKPTG